LEFAEVGAALAFVSMDSFWPKRSGGSRSVESVLKLRCPFSFLDRTETNMEYYE
jgi:hypothetical protein